VVVPTVADKYVSSAAHLAGRGPVSFEAMTNAVPVFREMPEDFKLGMDLSALAGVLHPVLHGFNYSPREAGFPGWVRFGSWFNEQNLVATRPPLHRLRGAAHGRPVLVEFQADVALLGPKADEWARDGLLYQPFPEVSRPWYHYHLWQALQQAGYGTDFVSEGVLRGARVGDGRLRYGTRAYGTLLVMDVVSLEPETAEAIARFGEAGGRVVFVGRAPDRAPGLKDAAEADRRVRRRSPPSGPGEAVSSPRQSGLLRPDYTAAPPDGARQAPAVGARDDAAARRPSGRGCRRAARGRGLRPPSCRRARDLLPREREPDRGPGRRGSLPHRRAKALALGLGDGHARAMRSPGDRTRGAPPRATGVDAGGVEMPRGRRYGASRICLTPVTNGYP
jgi:hypothetical protein